MSAKQDHETGHVRDKRNGKWWWCHNAVIDQYGPELGPHGLAVYAALCRYANDEGACWPSVAKIGHDTGMSPNRVRRSLADLERHGLISIERRSLGEVQLTSVYTLLDVEEWVTPNTTTSPHAVPLPHAMQGGTSPREVGVLHHVQGGTSPREAKEDSGKKTQSEKDPMKKSVTASAAPPPPDPIATEDKTPKPARASQPTRRVSTANPRSPEQRALCEELVDGLQEVTGMLRQTNRSALYTAGWTLVDLLDAGLAPSKGHLLQAFGQTDPGPGHWWWYRDDQRVKIDLDKGRDAPMPKPHQVAEMYTVSLKPPPAVNGKPPGKGRNSEAWQALAAQPTMLDLRRERERKAEEERRRQYGIK